MFFFFFFKQKTAYEIGVRLVGSEMCIRDSFYSDIIFYEFSTLPIFKFFPNNMQCIFCLKLHLTLGIFLVRYSFFSKKSGTFFSSALCAITIKILFFTIRKFFPDYIQCATGFKPFNLLFIVSVVHRERISST